MTVTVVYPDGTRVVGGRIMEAPRDGRLAPPDLGLYAHGTGRPAPTILGRLLNSFARRPLHAGSWSPTWETVWLGWPDMGVPSDPVATAGAIDLAFARARRGERVDVRCLGGAGRTGTILACMAVLAGVPSDEAVAWVRGAYAPGAVERASQAAWVGWFATHWTATGPP